VDNGAKPVVRGRRCCATLCAWPVRADRLPSKPVARRPNCRGMSTSDVPHASTVIIIYIISVPGLTHTHTHAYTFERDVVGTSEKPSLDPAQSSFDASSGSVARRKPPSKVSRRNGFTLSSHNCYKRILRPIYSFWGIDLSAAIDGYIRKSYIQHSICVWYHYYNRSTDENSSYNRYLCLRLDALFCATSISCLRRYVA